MKNLDKKEKLSWFLIAISPITFGILIVVAISILIAKHFDVNIEEGAIIVFPVYLMYTYTWARIFRKVEGFSWLD